MLILLYSPWTILLVDKKTTNKTEREKWVEYSNIKLPWKSLDNIRKKLT